MVGFDDSSRPGDDRSVSEHTGPREAEPDDVIPIVRARNRAMGDACVRRSAVPGAALPDPLVPNVDTEGLTIGGKFSGGGGCSTVPEQTGGLSAAALMALALIRRREDD